MRPGIAVLVLAPLVGSGLVAQQATNPSATATAVVLTDRIPTDAKIKIGVLPNGLRYYIRQNKKPEKRAELRLAINAGSILETDDQQGFAHFIEHTAFNGTEHFAKNDLVKYLQSIGVRFGADLNAYTSFDETVYILPVPTDTARIVEQAFTILEDWAHRLVQQFKLLAHGHAGERDTQHDRLSTAAPRLALVHREDTARG